MKEQDKETKRNSLETRCTDEQVHHLRLFAKLNDLYLYLGWAWLKPKVGGP